MMNHIKYTLTAICFIALSSLAHAQQGWGASRSRAICSKSHDQQNPAVSSDTQLGTIIVWQDDWPSGKKKGTKFPRSVYGKTMKNGRQIMVFSPKDQNAMNPAISGRHVVLVHNRGWTNVRLHTLKKDAGINIDSIAYTPAIDGNLIVYTSAKHRWEGWTGKGAPKTSWIGDILAYEIGGIGLPFDVTNNDKALQSNPDVSGVTVVWQESRARSGWGNAGIYKRNIDMDVYPVNICKNVGKTAQNPAISGSIIVWQDNRNGNWDIYGYDLTAGQEIEICTDMGDQELPDIDGNTIVWQDNRNSNWDIYAYDLTSRKTFAIYQGKANQTQPAIHKNVVVWTDDRKGNKDIYMNSKQ